MTQPDKDIAARLPAARAGSGAAVGEILEACRGYLLLIAQRELDPHLRIKGGASDLVQQTMLDAVRDFGRFHGASEVELLAWLRRLLLNNLTDLARQFRETDKRQLGREVSLDAGAPGERRGRDVPAPLPSPSGIAISAEQAEAVHRALRRLPEEYRQVIVLRLQDDLPFEEIGQALGRTANAARKLWARAVERLQQELETPA
jgi:RNA polymerase sigma-70 factor (ECF subfamily)